MSRDLITTVIATSPVPTIPMIEHIRTTIESLGYVKMLAESRVVIIFDGTKESVMLYEEYKKSVALYCASKPNIKLVFLKEWGHLSGVMEQALCHVFTPFIFVQQHDLPIIRSFELDRVLLCMQNDKLVRHVRLNRRSNLPVGWDDTSLFGAYKNPWVPLTRTGCWSDQSHITTKEYYLKVVLPAVSGKKVFMEDILNKQIHRLPLDIAEEAHRRLGTFIYGSPGSLPVVRHTDARNDMPSE